MAFVNEYIPEEDLEKYNFDELNKRPSKGGDQSRDWTIDRDADIWLRKFYTESDHTAADGGYTGVSAWDFYWKGTLMLLEVIGVESRGGGIGKPRWQRSKLLNINIPSELNDQRIQILKDLELAFNAHKGSGIFSTYSSYSFILEV